MWSSLIHWAQRQIWQDSHDTLAIPPLPFLPPPPSRSENANAQDVATTVPAPHNGAFFERLSPDLRRIILIEAFGDRTIHIDLRLDRPLRARPPRKTMHAGGVDVLDQGHSASRQMKKPRAWQWYSCVCHRDPESCVERWHGPGKGEMASNPAMDSCLRRRPQSCDRPPGDTGDMSRCFLGVMGWLMTCRQAHIEGIDILYFTNRFHMSSVPLILHFPRLLPAKAVTDIQSVEMCWDLGQVAQPPVTGRDISAEPRFGGWRVFSTLLKQLPKSLPHLKYLHLTLRGTWFPPQMAVNDQARHTESAMLQPLDKMVRQLYRTSGWSTPRYIVEIPADIFQASILLDTDTPEESPEATLGWAPKRRLVWRSIEPESTDQSALKDKAGYWLEQEPLIAEQASVLEVNRVALPSLALAGDW